MQFGKIGVKFEKVRVKFEFTLIFCCSTVSKGCCSSVFLLVRFLFFAPFRYICQEVRFSVNLLKGTRLDLPLSAT